MKKIYLFVFSVLSLCNFSFSQFIVKTTFFETTDVSNQGLVVGYTDWGGPYSIWTPENQNLQSIAGLAPGNGIGGQATFSADGNFLSGTSMGTTSAVMSRYNLTTNSWELCGGLGFEVDNSISAGFAISDHGSTVVGNSWADTSGGLVYTTAVAWNVNDGVIDLGTLHLGRSTRANAISSNGNVIVGWQDFNGPWKSAVWRKDGFGNFTPNQYLLKDSQGNAADEFNQLGECKAISADGNWIGGEGDFATDGKPWLWSENKGYIDLGTLADGATGFVSSINENGSIAVGRLTIGPWDPQIPFIWTQNDGMQNLNDYATNTLGLDLGSKQIYSARPLQGKLVINNLIVNNLSLKNFLFSIFFHTFEYEKGTKYRFCGFYG